MMIRKPFDIAEILRLLKITRFATRSNGNMNI